MISTTSFLACFVTLFASLILPVLVLIVYAVKNKGQGIFSAWLLGAAGFVVPQLLIRLPLLNLLAAADGFASFSQNHLFLYSFSLAFTAGLFELAGRFAAAKLLGKHLTFRRSLAAGLGHGGIEAMLIVGLTYVNNLIFMFMIQTGSFDALIAQTAASGTDASQLTAIRDILLQTSGTLYLLAGLERLLTMVCQTALSMIVCYGVYTGHTLRGLLVCLGMHTLLDTSAGISLLAGSVISQSTAYLIIYALLAIIAAVSLLVLKHIRTRWCDGPAQSQCIAGGTL